MSDYPNDPDQPGGSGKQQPDDGSGHPQYGSQPYGAPQYGAPQGPAYGSEPYGAPQYGAPQGSPYGAPMTSPNHKRAVLIMVLGILSIPCCGLFTGIPAIVLGRQALSEIDSSGGAIGGRGKVQAGFICGIIGTVLSVIGVIIRLTVSR